MEKETVRVNNGNGEKVGHYSPKDLFRIAPLGESMALANLVGALLNHGTPIVSVIGVIGALCGSAIAFKQFKLKGSLEKSISTHGYQERVMDATLRTWCDRQTTRVVSEKYHMLSRYDMQIMDSKKKLELRKIPHF